ncbi:MAG: DNA photolyase family protein, partial [Bacteroidota bacterium]|nr:DNA photolyase family protein [Bacteroidota bacterium]MDX5430216.1 DNA photolyase family protein [Bacteroidota bacterium]MDX5468978.1 DNA photolyase family protein [Bacteroidota bacterium]
LPLFIFDRNILDQLEDQDDARVTFIHLSLQKIKADLRALGSDLLVKEGTPMEVFQTLLEDYEVKEVYTNRDYEPKAISRDEQINALLSSKGIPFHRFKDQVIYERDEILKDNGDPYVVYTPYSKNWKAKLAMDGIPHYASEKHPDSFFKFQAPPMPSLSDLGFSPSSISFPPEEISSGIIKNYDQTRDFPAKNGTSRLSVHFRFGTISIREKVRKAKDLNEKYLNELIWRDFYQMILFHFPRVTQGAFKPDYDKIQWRNRPEDFEKWRQGQTGYPLVDAGMRELLATGYMHNRVRMVVASFLCKHLLIDWRWGEAWFAQKLLDFDLASNNGGWQWAAGTGVDAAPYFRVFNPYLQHQKFDGQSAYIRRWVPEYGTPSYPKPMVDHEMARKRCLEVYQAALKE